jgi:hypothetical protein
VRDLKIRVNLKEVEGGPIFVGGQLKTKPQVYNDLDNAYNVHLNIARQNLGRYVFTQIGTSDTSYLPTVFSFNSCHDWMNNSF